MARLFRRKRRARDASSDPGQPALSEPSAAHYEHAPAGAQAHAPVPAGLDLDHLVGEGPVARTRGRLRRRLRHLRKVRELLLRDLGGLVLEIHRVGADDAANAQGLLVGRKLSRLAQLDAEIAELEEILGDRRPLVIREPGIGGACLNCGEIYGSSARFCWACGTAVAPGHGRRAMAPAAPTGYAQLAAPAPAPVEEPTAVQHPVDPRPFVDSEAHLLGDQPTEVLPPEQPTEPFDPPAEPVEQPTEAFDPPPEPPAEPPAVALDPPAGPSTIDLPVPPDIARLSSTHAAVEQPHPADSLWSDGPAEPADAPPTLSSGDPLAIRAKPDA